MDRSHILLFIVITNEDVQGTLDSLDGDVVSLTVSLLANQATNDLLDFEILTSELNVANDTPGVNGTLEVGRVGDQLIARDGVVA